MKHRGYNLQKKKKKKSYSLGDVLARIVDCMASNTKGMEASFFKKCTAVAYKHIGEWVHFLSLHSILFIPA